MSSEYSGVSDDPARVDGAASTGRVRALLASWSTDDLKALLDEIESVIDGVPSPIHDEVVAAAGSTAAQDSAAQDTVAQDTAAQDIGDAASSARRPADGARKRKPTQMGLATYAIIAVKSRWGILHDGNVEGDHATKEAAFEAAVAAASLAIREGHEVHVSVPSRDAGNQTTLGGRE